MTRTSVLLALAAATLLLTGCGAGSDPAAPDRPGTVAPTLDAAVDQDLGPLPEASGPITDAGDLCRVVDAEIARRALGFSGGLEAVVEETSRPIREGIVSCSYRGTTEDGTFAAVLVSVQSYDAAVWGYGVTSMEMRGGKRGSQAGADDVVFWDRDGRTVQVRVGDHQAQSINGTSGRFTEEGLTRLATVAASAAA